MVGKTDRNPNDALGGGCIGAGVTRSADCQGPWLVFPLVQMENITSPHCTICDFHFREALDELVDGETAVIEQH